MPASTKRESVGVEQRAVEQLKVEWTSDADGFVREDRPCAEPYSGRTRRRAPCGPAPSTAARTTAPLVERRIGRSRRLHHAAETKPSAIEFAQRKGIDDRGASLQRRGACAWRAAKALQSRQNVQDRDQETQRPAHPSQCRAPQTPVQGARRLLVGKIAEKRATSQSKRAAYVRHRSRVSVRRSGRGWSRPPSGRPGAGSRRCGQGPARDRRHRLRRRRAGLRSARRHG